MQQYTGEEKSLGPMKYRENKAFMRKMFWTKVIRFKKIYLL